MRARAVLFDLLMAVMNSLHVWTTAAGDRALGLAWRDGVTRRMTAVRAYVPYDSLVRETAAEVGLPPHAPASLAQRWAAMDPWPDAGALRRLAVPWAFVTNCSAELARIAAGRSGADPRFTLSAEEAGWYKPHPAIYREACQRLGVAPDETLFVAGSPYDAQGARGAGLQASLVLRRPEQPPPAGITVARSLDEIVDPVGPPA